MRHQRLLLGLTQSLLDSLLNPRQAGAVLVLGQFANTTHASVAKVIDVIDLATTIAQINQNLHD